VRDDWLSLGRHLPAMREADEMTVDWNQTVKFLQT